jgi:hypothetical protein
MKPSVEVACQTQLRFLTYQNNSLCKKHTSFCKAIQAATPDFMRVYVRQYCAAAQNLLDLGADAPGWHS